jgi:hypothetical protein
MGKADSTKPELLTGNTGEDNLVEIQTPAILYGGEINNDRNSDYQARRKASGYRSVCTKPKNVVPRPVE